MKPKPGKRFKRWYGTARRKGKLRRDMRPYIPIWKHDSIFTIG